MTDTHVEQHSGGAVLLAVSNAMVALHKEQFGRGPVKARSGFAGEDTLVSVLEGGLLPAEHAMVEMGEQHRVRESRMFMQVATEVRFVAAIEGIVGRKVRAFSSAADPDNDVIFEVFLFEPRGEDGSPADKDHAVPFGALTGT